MTALAERLSRTMATTAFRLAAVSAAVFLLIATVIIGALFWQTNELLTDQVISGLRAEVAELARESGGNGLTALADKISARSRPGGVQLYYLGKPNGEKIAGNLERIPPEIAGSEKGGVFRYEDETNGRTRLGVAIPVDAGLGVQLVIGRDIEDQRAYTARIRRTFLLAFGIISLSALAVGLWAGRSVLRRIEEINATSRSIMAGDLSRRVPLSGSNDELDDLARSLNAMLERIEQLMSGLREVSDNIAHDLKTPLNRLRNRAEAALRSPRGSDAYREGLEGTIETADELIKTFNALLLIARLEAGVVDESAERFDLCKLVGDVAELYEPVAEEAGLRLSIDVGVDIAIDANRHLIGQAVANLVDNAIKYAGRSDVTPELKVIAITAHAKGETVEISVADHGPGIAEKDRDRALRRFVRLEESRSEPGTGLGLSLVAAVARLHRGSVRLEDNEPGLRVILTIPLRRSAS